MATDQFDDVQEDEGSDPLESLMDEAIDPDEMTPEEFDDYSIARAAGFDISKAYRVAAGHAWRLYYEDKAKQQNVAAMQEHIARCQKQLQREKERFEQRRKWRLNQLYYGFIEPFRSYFKGRQKSALLPGGITFVWRKRPETREWQTDPKDEKMLLAEEFVKSLPASMQMRFWRLNPQLDKAALAKCIKQGENGGWVFETVDEDGEVVTRPATVQRPTIDGGTLDLPIVAMKRPDEPLSYSLSAPEDEAAPEAEDE